MEILLNGKRSYFDGETLLELICDELLLAPEKILIAYVNGAAIGSDDYKTTKIQERDIVELFLQTNKQTPC